MAHDPMTIKQAADVCGVHSKTLYGAIARGDLPHFRRHRQQGIGVWSCDLGSGKRSGREESLCVNGIGE